ncbi:hypothetical protein [Streptomyces omiyaensis]|uniref:hypothetical protein n=1 Tax=Streptomyces omiyaensis TaxID=68247 RepID=UPI001E5B8A19|nr:hypothetical protein [Streptomyces omiyaensis]
MVAPWDRGDHTTGLHVTFTTGAQVWFGVTTASPPGAKGDEDPVVTGTPPATVDYPPLYQDGKVSPERAQDYLAAAAANSGHPEVASAYGYSPENQHPGFGVVFHSGARVHCLFHHTARAGQGAGGRELQAAF